MEGAKDANEGGCDSLGSQGRFHLENMRDQGLLGQASPYQAEKEEKEHSGKEKARYRGREARERPQALAGTRVTSRHSIDLRLSHLSNGEFELETAVK